MLGKRFVIVLNDDKMITGGGTNLCRVANFFLNARTHEKREPQKRVARAQKLVVTRVVYHGVTSSFFGIGILLVSDLLGFRYFGRYCCTVSFGGNTFLRIRGNSFLKNSAGIPFFLQKEGEAYKKGAEAPPS